MRKRTRLDATLPTFTVDGKPATPSVSAHSGVATFVFAPSDGWRAGMTKRVCVTIQRGEEVFFLCFVAVGVVCEGRAHHQNTNTTKKTKK